MESTGLVLAIWESLKSPRWFLFPAERSEQRCNLLLIIITRIIVSPYNVGFRISMFNFRECISPNHCLAIRWTLGVFLAVWLRGVSTVRQAWCTYDEVIWKQIRLLRYPSNNMCWAHCRVFMSEFIMTSESGKSRVDKRTFSRSHHQVCTYLAVDID